MASCKKPKAECVGGPVTKTQLNGKFSQYGYRNIREPFKSSTRHRFLFYGDSFKLEKHNFVTMPTPDSCKATEFYEFAKGAWSLDGNKLTVRGIYTDQNYQTKSSTCFSSGSFEYPYGAFNCNDTLTFTPPDNSVILPAGGIKLYKEQ
jgi:hypothetical protein